jgi:hypothetical protein
MGAKNAHPAFVAMVTSFEDKWDKLYTQREKNRKIAAIRVGKTNTRRRRQDKKTMRRIKTQHGRQLETKI